MLLKSHTHTDAPRSAVCHSLRLQTTKQLVVKPQGSKLEHTGKWRAWGCLLIGCPWRWGECQLATSASQTARLRRAVFEGQYSAGRGSPLTFMWDVCLRMTACAFVLFQTALLWAVLWENPGHCSVLPGCQWIVCMTSSCQCSGKKIRHLLFIISC